MQLIRGMEINYMIRYISIFATDQIISKTKNAIHDDLYSQSNFFGQRLSLKQTS
jgi:NAD/NADP transhydrogenase alpha subunit